MAEKKDFGVKDLEDEITCAICHEHYQEPKVLSCCHYYCKQCIHRLALRTGLDKPFSCPQCRKDTTLPQGGVDNLQAAFFVNRLKQVHSKLERATGEVEAKCELCSEDKATAFCRQCAQFICAECVKSHQRMRKVFSGHKISTIEELKEGGAKEIVTPEPTLQTCKEHEQQMNIFCFDCGCLICRDCTIKDHHGHNYEFVKKAASQVKKGLSQHLQPLREIKDGLMCAVKEVRTTRSELEAEGHAVVARIETLCDELCQIIQHRKKQLVTEAEAKIAQTSGGLTGQEKQLSTSCAGADSVIEFTQHCMEHLTDDEIMCMHVELQSRIDRAIEEQQKAGNSLEPVEEVDVTVDVRFAEELKQLCQTKAKIIQIPLDPSKCTVVCKGAENAEVGKSSEVTVLTRLANGKLTKQKCVVECHLKSLVDGSSGKCKVDQVKGHEYRIQYMPTVRGRHELSVTVNGVEVADSPFPVFASIHPNQLGKPVRVISGFSLPAGVAYNSEGEIVLCELYGDVVLLDKKGNRLASIKKSEHNLDHLLGVAVDGDDNIYFVEQKRNIIYKSDKQMKKITSKTTNQKGDPGHWCVAVVGDEVMVCDREGNINIYSKELEYVRQIAGTFISISSDEHGNLYVSNSTNSCINVYTNEGHLLRSFGCDEDGVKKLKCPFGICVSGQYVYVSNTDCHNISVFTTQGQYVTSFGQEGMEEGEFYHPWGVCVDRDGFVYVCDCSNNRVQVF